MTNKTRRSSLRRRDWKVTKLEEQSMSVSVGELAGDKHNVDYEYRKQLGNVEPSRIKYDKVLRNDTLEEVYNYHFAEACEAYNAKQIERGHKERCINDYLDHIKNSKQEKVAYEYVLQIGNKDTNSAENPLNRELNTEILEAVFNRINQEFPNFDFYQAAIHNDEATPHLHIACVPICAKTGKNGLDVKNSLSGALRAMNIENVNDVRTRMFEILELEAAKRGVWRLDMNCTRAHQNVRDFKSLANDIAKQENYPFKNDPNLVQALKSQQAIIDGLVEVVEHDDAVFEELENHGAIGLKDAVREASAARKQLWPDRIKNARNFVKEVSEAIRNIPLYVRDYVMHVSDKIRDEVGLADIDESTRVKEIEEYSPMDDIADFQRLADSQRSGHKRSEYLH